LFRFSKLPFTLLVPSLHFWRRLSSPRIPDLKPVGLFLSLMRIGVRCLFLLFFLDSLFRIQRRNITACPFNPPSLSPPPSLQSQIFASRKGFGYHSFKFFLRPPLLRLFLFTSQPTSIFQSQISNQAQVFPTSWRDFLPLRRLLRFLNSSQNRGILSICPMSSTSFFYPFFF